MRKYEIKSLLITIDRIEKQMNECKVSISKELEKLSKLEKSFKLVTDSLRNGKLTRQPRGNERT